MNYYYKASRMSDPLNTSLGPWEEGTTHRETDNLTIDDKDNNKNITMYPFARDEELAKIEIGVLAVIFILAIFGNTSVLIALRTNKKKGRMHMFIMHLSVADLLVAFLNILPQMVWEVTYRFQGGDFLCKIVKYFQVSVMYLSTYILVMTAIDRFLAICHPLSNYSWTPRKVHLMVFVAYMLSFLFSIPQLLIFAKRDVGNQTGVYDCWARFPDAPSDHLAKTYITIFTVLVFIIPFLILVFTYGSICCKVWDTVRWGTASEEAPGINAIMVFKFDKTNNIYQGLKNKQKARQSIVQQNAVHSRMHSLRRLSKAKMKTIKLTFVVVIAYLLCWSPFFICQILWVYDNNVNYTHPAFVIVLLLGSLNSCCNPWIYMAFSGTLVYKVFPCCKRGSKYSPFRKNVAKKPPKNKNRSDSLGSESDERADHGDRQGKANGKRLADATSPSQSVKTCLTRVDSNSTSSGRFWRSKSKTSSDSFRFSRDSSTKDRNRIDTSHKLVIPGAGIYGDKPALSDIKEIPTSRFNETSSSKSKTSNGIASQGANKQSEHGASANKNHHGAHPNQIHSISPTKSKEHLEFLCTSI
ncbi:unnamed protein product [Owenia fusiformis]|uniref:Uncharacterized protein n=1 Tax=Owenia fusiformis TaxID=6347 RepID=A0A8J1UGE9_OWEFU|nr:unnamed protein product [Owenia fusiformis]